MTPPVNNAHVVRSLLSVAMASSQDPNTQVGAVAEVRGSWITGSNRLPAGIARGNQRVERPAKYQWLEHAERNLIYRAARAGISLEGATMYLSWFPCEDCARAIVAVGVCRLYCHQPDYNDPRWGEGFKTAQAILRAGDVEISPLEEVIGGE